MLAGMSFNQNEMTSPVWLADFGAPERLLNGAIKLDAAAFAAVAGHTITSTANAAVGATAIAVTALAQPIPSGTVLLFNGGKHATTSASVAAGAVSIPVLALSEAIPSGSTATHNGDLSARKLVRAGTLVGRTFAERDAKAAFGPAADTDDEVFLLAFDVKDAERNPMGTAVRHASLIKENFVPGFASLSAALQAKVRAVYQTTIGQP